MATQKTPSVDDLEPVDTNRDHEYDSEWIELDQAEPAAAEIRDRTLNCGKYDTTVMELAHAIGNVVEIPDGRPTRRRCSR